jgi:hypothetical protein
MAPQRRTRKGSKKPAEPVPCQYGCGRPAEGTLSIDFTKFDDDDPLAFRHSFRVSIPTCRQCTKASVQLTVSIPKVGNDVVMT